MAKGRVMRGKGRVCMGKGACVAEMARVAEGQDIHGRRDGHCSGLIYPSLQSNAKNDNIGIFV